MTALTSAVTECAPNLSRPETGQTIPRSGSVPRAFAAALRNSRSVSGNLFNHEKKFMLSPVDENVRPREHDDAALRPRESPTEVKSTETYGTSSLDKFERQYASHPRQLSVSGKRALPPLYLCWGL